MVTNAFWYFISLKEFQVRQHEEHENLNGVDVIADDIFVYGRGETYEKGRRALLIIKKT